ncbi:MAG TPA: acyl-CoA dehydrogenase family protein [Candidatus Thermoplasmatota archaeon]|nr:acyl-CoA dehydrogenase family protein [Candidatus Thermoplasmatota archaeon]
MPFHITSDQDLVRKTVRELVEEVRGKTAEHIDRERAWPGEQIRKLAGMGLTGMLVPAELGGPGTDTVSFVLALEEIARASGVLALAVNNANALGSYPVATHAGDEVRASVVPALLTGEKLAAWALSEPGAGSDWTGVRTVAKKGDDGYTLDGVKSFVTGAPHAAWFVVFAAVKRGADASSARVPGTEGLTALLVPSDAPGVTVAQPERTMTMRGSDMAQVFLKGVRVPESHRLGAEGDGLAIATQANQLAALGGAAIAVGLMQAALEDSAAYANQREQFRTPLKGFQAIQFLVADLEVELRAARLLTYAAADKRDRGEDAGAEIAAAKLFAGEVSKHVTQKALRIHGGTGFMRDLPLERYNRDARSLSIYAGTAEMQRAAIAAKTLGL